ncbi:hypothetical protein ACW0UU_00835 [Fusobacterium polymorphum]
MNTITIACTVLFSLLFIGVWIHAPPKTDNTRDEFFLGGRLT